MTELIRENMGETDSGLVIAFLFRISISISFDVLGSANGIAEGVELTYN